MKRYKVTIVECTSGTWLIRAADESEARAEAENRLMGGDRSWFLSELYPGHVEVYSVEEVAGDDESDSDEIRGARGRGRRSR